MEFLDELNENGDKTGRVIERETAHRDGILHATSQIYIYRKNGGRIEILLQRRSHDKDSFPDLWDISCAGHVPSGETYDSNAIKELREELGLDLPLADLKRIALFRTSKKAVFRGVPFCDEQLSAVYITEYSVPEETIVFQKEEISEVRWMDAEEIEQKLSQNDPVFCLDPKRFTVVMKHIREEAEHD